MLASGLYSATTLAADGTITINGEVIDQTCVINGGSTDIEVPLPTVSKSALGVAGDTAGETPFSINLEGCPAGSVRAYFEQDNINQSTGNISNKSNTEDNSDYATNVEVQLLNSELTVIDLTLNDDSQNPVVAVDTDSNATLNYFARYYATGDAMPGLVEAQAVYSIEYR